MAKQAMEWGVLGIADPLFKGRIAHIPELLQQDLRPIFGHQQFSVNRPNEPCLGGGVLL